MRLGRKAIVAVAAMVLPLVYTCSPTEHAGNSSQSGNAAVVGVLYNPGGTRAAGARVVFIPADNNPRAGLGKALVIDSAVTNDTGGYAIDSMPTDTYNVFGVGDSGLSYLDSVIVKPDSQAKPSDTLGAAGSVRGVIRLQPNHDSRTVFMLFMGTQTWIAPDDSVGNFRLANMAAGKYRVRILTTLDNYAVMDTSLSVTAGRDSVIADTIRLRFTGIPVVQGVRLSYDTLKQIVTLTWNRADTGLVASYNVYRRNVGLNSVFARINVSPVTDTVFRDSSGVQDSVYEYEVAAVNRGGTMGLFSVGVLVDVVPAFRLLDTISVGTVEPTSFSVCSDSTFYLAYRTEGRLTLLDVGADSQTEIGHVPPYDIATDSANNVYITAHDQNRVAKLSQRGDSLAGWSVDRPTLVATGRDGVTFVVFGDSRGIARLDTAGTLADSVLLVGASIVRLHVASNGNLLAADAFGLTVNEYTPDLGLLRTLAVPAVLPSYQVIAVDSFGNLYLKLQHLVGQVALYDILVYNRANEMVASFGPFNYANDAQIVGNAIYVLDFADNPWRSQIQKFSLPF